ncbi:hypothetical protein [Enterocloster lavalensis]|uniref:hypothetical protein n=1 Tax=Enterocloster lavalensis TaxID=460384 RepID=UPI001D08B713|nr:hypothetical protein [Enterocloster lavalensis]MCB6346449.1 hypothetical protein [Enterocloster lavalensis]
MTILASASNISADRALTIAAASLEKKGLAFWSPSYKVVSVDREAILVRYVPYYIMQICFAIPGGLRGKMGGRQIMAMEGITGEAGVALGAPSASEQEIPGDFVLVPRFDEREAREAIVRKLEQHMVRRKRVIPVIEHEFMELIYKPVYAVPLTYEDRRGVRHKCRKIVDGESGYLVYRYDRMEGLFG